MDEEPKHISEILPVSPDEIDVIVDSDRAHLIGERDLQHEIRGYEEDLAAIREEIESGNDTPEMRERLAQAKRALLSTQADLIQHNK